MDRLEVLRERYSLFFEAMDKQFSEKIEDIVPEISNSAQQFIEESYYEEQNPTMQEEPQEDEDVFQFIEIQEEIKPIPITGFKISSEPDSLVDFRNNINKMQRSPVKINEVDEPGFEFTTYGTPISRITAQSVQNNKSQYNNPKTNPQDDNKRNNDNNNFRKGQNNFNGRKFKPNQNYTRRY